MVEIRITIIRPGHDIHDDPVTAEIPELTTDEIAVVIAQLVDELGQRGAWSGPRPRVWFEQSREGYRDLLARTMIGAPIS
jgi:hypothetical protein